MDKKKILVVDDEESVPTLIKRALTVEGYDVITARNGQEALETLKSGAPHLIILDMNMPKMGGIAFYHSIANTYDASPRYPVLVLTGRGGLETVFQDFKIDGFMTKPFEIEGLGLKVKEIMEKHYGKEKTASFKQKTLKAHKVLLVEDDDETFDQLTLLLMNAGYLIRRVRMVQDVYLAVKAERPDIILMKLGTFQSLGPEVMVASRISHTAETKTPILMYVSDNAGCPVDVALSVQNSDGVAGLVPYTELKEILPMLEKVLA